MEDAARPFLDDALANLSTGSSVAGPISMSTPQMYLCEWEQPKQ